MSNSLALRGVPRISFLPPKFEDDLKKPSLVFVRNENAITGQTSGPYSLRAMGLMPRRRGCRAALAGLSPAARHSPGCAARSPASTAVAGPVWQRSNTTTNKAARLSCLRDQRPSASSNRQIPPDTYHCISPDGVSGGASEKIDGISMGLNYGQSKGWSTEDGEAPVSCPDADRAWNDGVVFCRRR